MTPKDISSLPYRPCVGVMLINDAGKVFVGQRLDSDMTAPAWQMPQGGVDPGEDPKDAALRELGEETGIKPDLVEILAETPNWVRYDLPHDLVPKLWKGRYRGQEQKWYLMRFLGTDDDVNIQTHTPEFSAWRWSAPDALVGNIVPFKRDVYLAVMHVFEAYL